MPLLRRENTIYLLYFVVAAAACAVVVLRKRASTSKVTVTAEFVKFQRSYLVVYVLAVLSDWCQGPYVYRLYQEYGFDEAAIGVLFVVGFGASAAVGTFVGAMADQTGRKRNCLLFFAIYAASCLTKHSSNYNILLFGRVLGGIATSILFSAFESWMVTEHKNQGFPDSWLDDTFSKMSTLNSICAIAAGLVSSAVVGVLGTVGAFDMSLLFLVIGGLIVAKTWKENFGNSSLAAGFAIRDGIDVVSKNPKVALVGIIQCCFESAMYIFVFMWSPVLEASASSSHMPHGLIFATFMVALMMGSNMFTDTSGAGVAENILRYAILVGAACLLVPTITSNHDLQLIAFCGFELVCGAYFPLQGGIRARILPGELRATIMNLYRVGINVVVVAVLLNIKTLSSAVVFMFCSASLVFAAACSHNLWVASSGSKASQAAAISAMQELDDGEDDVEGGGLPQEQEQPDAGDGDSLLNTPEQTV